MSSAFETQCHARSKGSGGIEQCRQHGIRKNRMGNWVCRFHGAYNFGRRPDTGRYSEYLGPLKDTFQKFLESDAIRDLNPTLALMDVQLSQLLERAMKFRDAPEWRDSVTRKCQDVLRAVVKTSEGRDTGTINALRDLLADLEAGVAADEALKSVVGIANLRATRTERAIELDLRASAVVTQAQLMSTLAVIADVISRQVPQDAKRVMLEIDRALRRDLGEPFLIEAEAQHIGSIREDGDTSERDLAGVDADADSSNS